MKPTPKPPEETIRLIEIPIQLPMLGGFPIHGIKVDGPRLQGRILQQDVLEVIRLNPGADKSTIIEKCRQQSWGKDLPDLEAQVTRALYRLVQRKQIQSKERRWTSV